MSQSVGRRGARALVFVRALVFAHDLAVVAPELAWFAPRTDVTAPGARAGLRPPPA